ncbi:hypothetical protein BLNAU_10652 [Blattamonas nauphoetae]|uniref:Uncharacterized protein n=1 Tax=Blattamonas nauphoetae TaxID=2049346 RepID=A0ABQ9XRK4_9EUKA|nr:hypothetical protein BLNAU_10652 [Blattamonas nauphoetae]
MDDNKEISMYSNYGTVRDDEVLVLGTSGSIGMSAERTKGGIIGLAKLKFQIFVIQDRNEENIPLGIIEGDSAVGILIDIVNSTTTLSHLRFHPSEIRSVRVGISSVVKKIPREIWVPSTDLPLGYNSRYLRLDHNVQHIDHPLITCPPPLRSGWECEHCGIIDEGQRQCSEGWTCSSNEYHDLISHCEHDDLEVSLERCRDNLNQPLHDPHFPLCLPHLPQLLMDLIHNIRTRGFALIESKTADSIRVSLHIASARSPASLLPIWK